MEKECRGFELRCDYKNTVNYDNVDNDTVII